MIQAMRRDKIIQSHLLRSKVALDNPQYQNACKMYFDLQLKFDLPENESDVTSDLAASFDREVSAEFIVKQDGIVAGTEEVIWFLKNQNSISDVFSDCIDGEFVKRDRRCLFVKGNARVLLKLERVLLNLLQRMSGVATYAYDIAHDAAQVNPYVLLCPTRKTLCGPLDKKAVMLAECGTHRVYLSDAILLKENHFAASDSEFDALIRKTADSKGGLDFIEIETESVAQAIRAAKILCEIKKLKNIQTPLGIMFDDFTPLNIRQAIDGICELGFYDELFFEASGGINKSNLNDYVSTEVDIISMGALTNSATALDISMKVV